jgi:hypothetical protein
LLSAAPLTGHDLCCTVLLSAAPLTGHGLCCTVLLSAAPLTGHDLCCMVLWRCLQTSVASAFGRPLGACVGAMCFAICLGSRIHVWDPSNAAAGGCPPVPGSWHARQGAPCHEPLLPAGRLAQVRSVIWRLFELCPTPQAACDADVSAIQDIIYPLGLYRKRGAWRQRGSVVAAECVAPSSMGSLSSFPSSALKVAPKCTCTCLRWRLVCAHSWSALTVQSRRTPAATALSEKALLAVEVWGCSAFM